MKPIILAAFYLCLLVIVTSKRPDGRFLASSVVALLCGPILAWFNRRRRRKTDWTGGKRSKRKSGQTTKKRSAPRLRRR